MMLDTSKNRISFILIFVITKFRRKLGQNSSPETEPLSLKNGRYIEEVFLAVILPKQEFIFNYGRQICNQIFRTFASFSLTVMLFLLLQLLCYSPCQEVLTYHIRWSTYLLLGTLYQDQGLDLCRLEIWQNPLRS